MTADADDVESFHERLQKIYKELGSHHNFVKVDLNNRISELAREWLRLSTDLKGSTDGLLPALADFDSVMGEIFKATKGRTRANSFKRLLTPFNERLMDEVLMPLMRHEGSPSQALGRQLEALFRGLVSAEEATYISEAARCSSASCFRATIVMLWAAVVARLHNQVQNKGFQAFNAATAISTKKSGQPFARITKNLQVASLADLQLARDFDVIAVGIELWGYDIQTFDELNRCLNTRNTAAHPGSYEPNSLDVRQFAEKIRRLVFEEIGSHQQ